MIPFFKYNATGNDFVIIDDRAGELTSLITTDWIRFLCHRRFGIGADGVIIINRSEHGQALYPLVQFNADGSDAGMCANGTRSAIHYLATAGGVPGELRLSVGGDRYSGRFEENQVHLLMAKTDKIDLDLSGLQVSKQHGLFDTGVPHLVLEVDDHHKIDLPKLGPFYRRHRLFSPQGVNVNFFHRSSDGTIHIRSFERGVEGETFSCGTGIVATARLLSQNQDGEFQFLTKGGRAKVRIVQGNYWYSGEVMQVFKSEIEGP